MLGRRAFLARAARAVAVIGAVGVAGSGRAASADQRKWYVWYRKNGGRYHGVGPYTNDEAARVQQDYVKQGYDAYVAGANG